VPDVDRVGVLVILQARMTSTRLPGKVLKPILGKPMIIHQLERIARSSKIDRTIVATSSDPTDAPIVAACEAAGFPTFRGSLQDVLDRFYRASATFPSKHVVRLTADCPLTDPEVIDGIVAMHLDGHFDYTTNTRFPDGLDVEVFTSAALADAWREATFPYDREHVTPFIRDNPRKFRLGDYVKGIDGDMSHHRWTVDEPADFEVVSRIYNALYPVKPNFGMNDVLKVMEQNPDWKELNSESARKSASLAR
jgi:spore coat polysaccharide biosynthesis protein SpsF